MTGPKKCEDCARPGVPRYTLFIWEQRQNITLRRRPVTPTHSALIVFLYLPYLSQMQNVLFITFFASASVSLLYLRVPRNINLSSITHLLLVVVHYAQCWHWNITRSGTRFARGISENHSPPVTREPGRGGAASDNCLQSESQYKISRFGTLEHKLCKSLNKDFIIASSVVGMICCKLDQHLSQGCK